MQRNLLLFVFILSLVSCQETKERTGNTSEEKLTKNIPAEELDITGTYVDDSYEKRMEGDDWVGIHISRTNDTEIKLAVRSRADKKKPTCLLDLKAYKVNDSLYEASANGSEIKISFNQDWIDISSKAEGALSYYCSSGATVAGTYQKIEGDLDSSQVDKTGFYVNLESQDIGFEIGSIEKDNGESLLQISPYGMSSENQVREHLFKGKVVNAEIEDLNADGFPEILVYLEKENDNGEVIAYSVNNGKSMSLISMTGLSSELRKSYNGFDEFRVVENRLFRRFPKFEFGSKTSVMVEINYELKNAEASRVFVPANVQEYEL